MNNSGKFVEESLDGEWIDLLLEAKAIGLSTEDIRIFLESKGKIKTNILT